MIDSLREIFLNLVYSLGYGGYGFDFAYTLYYCFGFIGCCTIIFIPFAIVIKIIRGLYE